MRFSSISFSAAVLLLLTVACSEPAKEKRAAIDNLIPKPSSVKADTGSFQLAANTTLNIDTANLELKKLAGYFNTLIKPATGFELAVKPAANDSTGIDLIIDTTIKKSPEAYTLSINGKKVTIKAGGGAGVFYGIQTIRQLLPDAIEATTKSEANWAIPAATIEDEPSYEYRGSMLDIARHFFGPKDIKRYIDLISFYKMNTLHLHLSDDQGWRIEIKSWPKLTEIGSTTQVGGGKGGFLSQEEYKDLVQYAADRYITIIPEIDMPGHTNAALASYAELNCNDTATKLYSGIEVGFSTLCTNKEVTYKFLDDVIRELAALTPGKYLHIGGDESHATKKEDYIPFMEKVQLLVKKHGKLAIGWDEVANSKLEPNTVAQYWADSANSVMAISKGAKLIMSPARKAYLDMQYDSTSKLGLHWAGYIEVDTAYTWDPANLEPGIKRENIWGVEAPLWTETIVTMDDIEYMVFPRLPGYAEIAWTPTASRSWDEYKVRLGYHGPRMKAMQIDYYPSKKIDWK